MKRTVYTSLQMRGIEQAAAEAGYAYSDMMFNAGIACADAIEAEYGSVGGKNVAVLCGSGNNGGDGFVAAERFCEHNARVSVILAMGKPKKPDAVKFFNELTNAEIIDLSDDYSAADRVINNADLIVDSIFGAGFSGRLPPQLEGLVCAVNDCRAVKAAIDLPSGAECDTGCVHAGCVRCSLTVAIASPKPAHIMLPARDFCGKTVYADIGFTAEHARSVENAGYFTFTGSTKELLPPCRTDAHKGDFGKALSICGSRRYAGAAVLAARGAVRSGAGLVFAAFPESAYPAIAPKLVEPILLPQSADENGFFAGDGFDELHACIKKATAVLIGCGIGKTNGTRRLLERVLGDCTSPIIIDADGINLVAENIDILKAARAPVILTPHPAEMSRLCGAGVEDIQANRLETARRFAQENGVTLVLKGSGTVAASPSGECFVNTTGNPGMAKGGSGDLLAGIMLGMLAQGLEAFEAAVKAVYLHGAAGDSARKRLSLHGMTPSDMAEELPLLLS